MEFSHHKDPWKYQRKSIDYTTKVWIEDSRMVRSNDDYTVIVQTDTKQWIFIDHGTKTYQVATLPIVVPKKYKTKIDMVKEVIDITKTGEIQTIDKFSCEKVILTITTEQPFTVSKLVMWCTKDNTIPYRKYLDCAKYGIPGDLGYVKKWEKMAEADIGFPIETTIDMANHQEYTNSVTGGGSWVATATTINGATGENAWSVRSTEKLIKVEQMTFPAITFDAPAGYKKKNFDLTSIIKVLAKSNVQRP